MRFTCSAEQDRPSKVGPPKAYWSKSCTHAPRVQTPMDPSKHIKRNNTCASHASHALHTHGINIESDNLVNIIRRTTSDASEGPKRQQRSKEQARPPDDATNLKSIVFAQLHIVG